MLKRMSVQSIDSEVAAVMESYPGKARKRLEEIRKLVFEIAADLDVEIEETLKWSEPSYLVKGGSTVRLAYKAQRPDVCTVFVHCQTRLIETFREVYPDVFEYEGKRALHLPIKGRLNKAALRHCLTLAMTYHKVKHLPLLGA